MGGIIGAGLTIWLGLSALTAHVVGRAIRIRDYHEG